MKNIHFIVNPIAGSRKHKITEDLLLRHFEQARYKITLQYSQYKNHALALTQNAIFDKADIIVACGGDGTVNEVAAGLVHTKVMLGIVPMGSGNGLASHLNLPKNIIKAIQIIKNQENSCIDVGRVNDTYFFSNIGLGFDAAVVSHYEAMNTRGFFSYFKATMQALKTYHSSHTYNLYINDQSTCIEPFLFFISNTNVMGNNISFTPKASLQDGLFDIVSIPKLTLLKKIALGLCLLIKKSHVLPYVQYMKTNRLVLKNRDATAFHLQVDGEKKMMQHKKLHIALLPKALHVIAPFGR